MDSQLGEGALFWFTLPLLASKRQTVHSSGYFKGKRVLVIDSHSASQSILDDYLQFWGCEVEQVTSASLALDRLDNALEQQKKYDVLLLDTQIPKMGGLELVKKIHQKEAYEKTPCLLLFSEKVINPDYKITNSLQSIAKPIRKDVLFHTLSKLLNMKDDLPVIMSPNRIERPNYSDYKILVAEDNIINQKVISGLLRQFNITADLVDNGQLLLDRITIQKYDLIFMDCQMPVMDGYEATQKLREYYSAETVDSRVPVIALTAHASLSDKEKCLGVGMDDYLSKPIEGLLLADMLKKWLKKTG
ncbi:MAG: response regulator [Methylococcales bacterium]|nr:response regulator [Methylococcales bacterium]